MIAQRDYILDAMDALIGLKESMLDFADKHVETITPMYSFGLTVYGSSYHMQQAQVMTWGYYIMAFVNELERELEKLELAYKHMQISPAGSAIGTCTDIPNFNRHRTMELLGFDDLFTNCFDAEKYEFYVLDTYAPLLTLSYIISTLGRTFQIYSTYEFRLIELADRYCGTSSIMPQKKSPTALKWLSQVTTNVKARMVGDESIRGMYESWTDVINALKVLTGIIRTLKIDKKWNEERAGAFWTGAADLAIAIMVETGLPWRTAHQIVATLVRMAINEGKTPQDVTEEYLDKAATQYPDYGKPVGLSTERIQRSMNPRDMVNRRTLIGGPAPVRVREEIAKSRNLLGKDIAKVKAKRNKLQTAAKKLEKAIDTLIGA
jgi:argininosuccinate lyase